MLEGVLAVGDLDGLGEDEGRVGLGRALAAVRVVEEGERGALERPAGRDEAVEAALRGLRAAGRRRGLLVVAEARDAALARAGAERARCSGAGQRPRPNARWWYSRRASRSVSPAIFVTPSAR